MIWQVREAPIALAPAPTRDALTEPDDLTEENAQSINPANLFNGRLREVCDALPVHLQTASKIELDDLASPTPTDYALRKRITELVNNAKVEGKTKLATTRVYENIISRTAFFECIEKPAKVAWMIRPVVNHEVYYKAIHALALKKIWKILSVTEVDPKYLPQILKLAESAANRTIGPVVQRIQMHQKQEVTHTSGDPREVSEPNGPAELEAKIKEMQAKLSKVKPIEIEAKSLDDED